MLKFMNMPLKGFAGCIISTGLVFSLFMPQKAVAVDFAVSNEAQFDAAIAGVGAGDTITVSGVITLTGGKVLPDLDYAIQGTGSINTGGFDFRIPDNVSTIDLDMTYDGNTSIPSGGALNYDGTLNFQKTITFTNNQSDNNAGAIYGFSPTITMNNGATFTGNTATTGDGGAIAMDSTLTSFTINNGATFSGNTAPNGEGGAIYNQGDFIINGGPTFINNSSRGSGGAIYTGKVMSATSFTINGGATFTNNSSTNSAAGAIYNDGDSTFTINGNATFTSNSATNNNGGSIRNQGTFIINDGADFSQNQAWQGGAIHNFSTFTINDNVTFSNNSATNYGGAIFNQNGTFTINDGATFLNNSATTVGGAIHNGDTSGGTVNLIARTNNVEFTGNTAAGADNAIHMKEGGVDHSLNLNASDIANITFNDGITSEGNDNIIRINATNAIHNKIPADAPAAGEIVFNANMSGFDNSAGKTGNTINVYAGTLSLGTDINFGDTSILNLNGGTLSIEHNYTDNFFFNASPGSTLDLRSSAINAVDFTGTVNINNMNLKIDVDLTNLLADKISATTIDTNNSVILTELFLIDEGDGTGGTVTVDPNDDFDITLHNDAKIATGSVYNFNVANNDDGTLTFTKVADPSQAYNPAVQTPAIVQQSAHAAIANTNNIVFNRMDDVMNMIDTIKYQTGVDRRFVNKVAITEGTAEYSKLYGRLEKGSAWFRPFNSIESLDIDNITGEVDSVSYGAITGFDTPLYYLKRGFSGMASLYGGYSGASQEYRTIDLQQNGGFIGVSGGLYRNHFFTSLSTNAGVYGILENIKNFGSKSYGMFTTSVASKTGYNFHLPKQTVLQLNTMVGYTLVLSNDYTNAQGTRINSDPLHTLQVIPGLKLAKDINGWRPYISVNVPINAMNKSKIKANEVVLPKTKLGTYAEYGVGIENYSDDNKINGFLQVMVRNGSRTGVNFNFGLKYALGQETEKI